METVKEDGGSEGPVSYSDAVYQVSALNPVLFSATKLSEVSVDDDAMRSLQQYSDQHRLWVARCVISAKLDGDLAGWFRKSVKSKVFTPTLPESTERRGGLAAIQEFMALTYIVDPAVFAPTKNEVLAESDVFNYTVVMEAAGLLVHEVRPLLVEYTGVEGVWKSVDV